MYKIVGTTNEVTDCYCCGRTDLKKTVALMDDIGNVTYYGEICAGNQLGFFGKDSTIKKQIQNEIGKNKKELYKEIIRFKVDQPEYKYIQNWNGQLKDNPYVDVTKAKIKIEEFTKTITNKITEKYSELIKINNLKLSDII